MATIESAFLRNANNLTSNNPTLREGLLRVSLSEPFSFHFIFKSSLNTGETKNVDYKQLRKGKYLIWGCGFANAQGVEKSVEIGVEIGVEKSAEKSVEIGVEKSVEKSVEKIINIIKNNPRITVRELTSLLGLSRRGVEKNMKKLQEKGLLRRIGPDNGGHWEIIEK